MYHSDVIRVAETAVAEFRRRLRQRRYHLIVSRRRVALGQIFARSALATHRRRSYAEVAARNVELYAAACAYAQKRVCAALYQLLSRDRRRRPADTRRANRYLFAAERACIQIILAVLRYLHSVFQQRRYLRHSAGVAGEDNVPADLARLCAYVKLPSIIEAIFQPSSVVSAFSVSSLSSEFSFFSSCSACHSSKL